MILERDDLRIEHISSSLFNVSESSLTLNIKSFGLSVSLVPFFIAATVSPLNLCCYNLIILRSNKLVNPYIKIKLHKFYGGVLYRLLIFSFPSYYIYEKQSNQTNRKESPETTCFSTCLVQKSKPDNTIQPDKHTNFDSFSIFLENAYSYTQLHRNTNAGGVTQIYLHNH